MGAVLSSKQRENLAKYSYDVSKIIGAILIIGPLTRPEQISSVGLIVGVAGSLVFLGIGLLLDKETGL
jgi:hypothetical protein